MPAFMLDVQKALQLGAEFPTSGVFRGEYVAVIRQGKPGWLFVKMTVNQLYKDEEYEVPQEALIPSKGCCV